MEDFIKNIIVEKRFFELTPKEKSMIKEWAENEEEFDALKLTFLSASSFNQEKQAELSPSVKNRLNERFAAKHVHQKEMWMNKLLLFFFPRDTQFFKKPAFQLVMVALTVVLVIPFLWQNDAPQYAMNEDREQIEIKEIQSENSKVDEKETFDTQAKVEINEESENISKTSDISEKQLETLNLEIARDIVNPMMSSPENDVVSEEVYLKEIVETESAKRAFNITQQLDEVQAEMDKDFVSKYKKTIPNTVDASETLGLLTALY